MITAKRPGVLPPLTPAQKKACEQVVLVMDEQGRTAIELSRNGDEVCYVPMAPEGLFLLVTSPSVFARKYPHRNIGDNAPKSLRDATVPHAARCYVSHAALCGAEPAVVQQLEKLVPITPHEKEKIAMASKKAPEKSEKKGKAAKAEKSTPGKKGSAAAKSRAGSVAATMKSLIMEGGRTDDQIFAEAKKRCPGLDDSKRSYVAWYRNDLKKKGENPPAQKKAVKE